jgi:hypothetical protein
LVDTDAKTSAISEEAYESIAATGYAGLLLSKAQVELDCGGLYTRVFDQYVHLIFRIDGDVFEQIFLIVPDLLVPVILGTDFQQENQFVIDYHKKCFWKEDNKYKRYDFSSATGHTTESGTNVTHSDHSSDAQTVQFALLPSQPPLIPSQPALIPSQPALMTSQPALIPSQPALIPSQPALMTSQPALIPSQPALIPSQPANQHSCQGSQDS